MGILDGVFEQSCCYEACRVSHVYHEESAYLVSYLAHAGIVPLAAVS